MMKRSIFLASAAALALTGLATAGLAAADKSPAPTNASGAILTNVKAGTPTRMEYELRAKAYMKIVSLAPEVI